MGDPLLQYFENKSTKTLSRSSNNLIGLSFEQKYKKQQKIAVLSQLVLQAKKEPNFKYQFKRLQMQKKIVDEQMLKIKQRHQKQVKQKEQKIKQLKKNARIGAIELQNQIQINKQLAKAYKMQQETITSLKKDLQIRKVKVGNQMQSQHKQYQQKLLLLKSQKQQLKVKNQALTAQWSRFREQKTKQNNQICQKYENELKQVNSRLQVKQKQLKIAQQDVKNMREQASKLKTQNHNKVLELNGIIQSKDQRIEQLQKDLQVLQSTFSQLQNAQNSINLYEQAIAQKQKYLIGFVTEYEQITAFIQKTFEFQFPQQLDLKGMIEFIHVQFSKYKEQTFLKIKISQHAVQQINDKINLLIEENTFLKLQIDQNKSFNKTKDRQMFLMGQKAEQLRQIRESHQIHQRMKIDHRNMNNIQTEFRQPMRNGSLPNLKSMVCIQKEKEKNKILQNCIKQNIRPLPNAKCSMQDLILKKCKDIVF